MSVSPATIPVYLNGEPREIAAQASISALLESLSLPPQAALVELNGRALLRSEWPETRFNNGDRIEILRVVAGG